MHIFAKAPVLTKCQKCGKPVPGHTVCYVCGYYKKREVLDVLKKLTKKDRKKREKEMQVKEEAEKREVKKGDQLNWEELSKK